jgi:cyclopropane fatty-acyl-phospholipid synthase-like methyltransferase
MNLESYNEIAEQWARHRDTLSTKEAEILPMLTEGLAPNSTLLDLGCGTGQPVATYFAEAGFQIVGVDQSPAMLALARRRLPTHQWLLGTLEDFPPISHVAAVVAWDSLFHVPRDQHANIFRRVRAALPVGGGFALTVGGSEHPAFTDVMFGHTFFYDSFPPAQVVALLEAAGFRIVHESYLNYPDGARDKGRVALVARAQYPQT